MSNGLQAAIEKAGGVKNLADQLGVHRSAVYQWDQVPPLRVLEVERLTGVPRHELRPDLYPLEMAAE